MIEKDDHFVSTLSDHRSGLAQAIMMAARSHMQMLTGRTGCWWFLMIIRYHQIFIRYLYQKMFIFAFLSFWASTVELRSGHCFRPTQNLVLDTKHLLKPQAGRHLLDRGDWMEFSKGQCLAYGHAHLRCLFAALTNAEMVVLTNVIWNFSPHFVS